MAVQVDIGVRADVDRLTDDVVAAHGRVDALVHCAATSRRGGPLDTSDEDWDDVLRVNLDAAFWLGRGFGRLMTEQRSGTMVYLTSDRGLLGSAEATAYAASKGGVIALVKSFALAFAKSGVTVNGINPGTTDTPLARGGLTDEEWRARLEKDPLGRVSMPEDIAEIVAFLCGPARSFMTGQIVTTRIR